MEGISFKREAAASLLGNQAFRRLWAAQFSAIAAIYGLNLAGVTIVEQRTQSSAQTGLVILSAILPAFLGSLVSGAVVDRWGRKRSLVASHLARALTALGFWAGTRWLPGGPALATVYLANFAGATFSQFATPAELAMLPDLVHGSRLTAANALLQLGTLAAEGLGIILLSPLLIKSFGAPSVGLAGGLMGLLALALALLLPPDRAPAGGAEGAPAPSWAQLVDDMRDGWRTIAGDRLLRLVAIQATVAATLLLVVLSLVPGLVSRHLGLTVADAPLLILPGGLGFVVGAALLSRLERRLSRPTWIGLGLVVLGLGIGLLALLSGGAGRLELIVPVIVVIGVSLALVIVTARVVLQAQPPAEMRGRVIAAQLALANAMAVVPLLAGGSLADQLGILPVMGALGLLAVLAGLVGLRFRRA
jgi:MFS family permease